MSAPSRLLLSDPDARARLRAVAALRDDFDLVTLDPGEDAVRAVRRLRPVLMLLAMPRARMTEALRVCRVLKTDAGTPPTIGLVDRWGRLGDPDRTLESCLGDGYLAGKATNEALVAFARALERGERPIHRFEPELGLVGKLLGRNFP